MSAAADLIKALPSTIPSGGISANQAKRLVHSARELGDLLEHWRGRAQSAEADALAVRESTSVLIHQERTSLLRPTVGAGVAVVTNGASQVVEGALFDFLPRGTVRFLVAAGLAATAVATEQPLLLEAATGPVVSLSGEMAENVGLALRDRTMLHLQLTEAQLEALRPHLDAVAELEAA